MPVPSSTAATRPVEPSSRTRPGRGEKPCPCCSGRGEHSDGSECDGCDGQGVLHQNEQPVYCPGQARPRRRHWRQGAAGEGDAGPLRNPVTNGREWYHGTKASSAQLADGGLKAPKYQKELEDTYGHAHWNSLLGVHFAANHRMADRFTTPRSGGIALDNETHAANQTPSVVHARLGIKNPKVYRSEEAMADEVYEHEHGERRNYIDNHLTRPDGTEHKSDNAWEFEGDSQHHIPKGEMEDADPWEASDDPHPPIPRRVLWLNGHPDKENIAARYKQRLQDAGHDGIIYENDHRHERVRSLGEHANKVAIAFHPHQIQITKHHHAGDESRMASRIAAWAPSSGIFAPTTGYDTTLFDEHHRLRPMVRRDLMERLDQALRVDGGLTGSEWQDELRVYIAGGSASEWAGGRPNDSAVDLDILIGVDYPAFRGNQARGNPEAITTNDQIDAALNTCLRNWFNDPAWRPGFGGLWDLTGYVNPDAWDIRRIKPYAAWDVTNSRWAVRPPHLPGHTMADFDPALLTEARAVAAWARSILRLPEPARTREAKGLWEHIHRDRSRAFSPDGEGWQDPGNLIEKWLAYAPHGLLGKIRELAFAEHPTKQAVSLELTPDGATNVGPKAAMTGYDGLDDRTAMVCLEVPRGLVETVPGGVEEDPHITVVYLGKISEKRYWEICAEAMEAAEHAAPLHGSMGGVGTFPPGDGSDGKTPAFVPVHLPGAEQIRARLEHLNASKHTDWKPHVTLAYLEDGDPVPPPHPSRPLHFTHLTVERGDRRMRFPLGDNS